MTNWLFEVTKHPEYVLLLNLKPSQRRGSPHHRVANLWTEFSAQDGEALATDVKDLKTLDFPRWLQLSKRQILTFLPVV
jgi:hypothetical protein